MDYYRQSELEDAAPGGSAVVAFIDQLIQRAVMEHASDIHIEPDHMQMRVRIRVDGVLREVETKPIEYLSPVVSRIKVLANLDISEHRRPQDGRFRVRIQQDDIDLRVSTFPTTFGENAVLRMLDKSQIILSLEQLGMDPADLERYHKFIQKLYGLVLVTGPNSSGKTTTLYSSLNILNSIDRSIATLEDPVEYQLPLIRQTQVDIESRLTFAEGLRSLLRQDPDTIMVGEIRDRETASMAVQASLTGHLVLSTLHTNDAVGALTRLANMGIEPVLLSSAIIGVIAQRLVRHVCGNCAEPYTPSKELARQFGFSEKTTLFRAKGCPQCNQTGYHGRVGIFEVLEMTPKIRDLITKRASQEELLEAARSNGMRMLREDGIQKALKKITTIEEVIRVTEAIQTLDPAGEPVAEKK